MTVTVTRTKSKGLKSSYTVLSTANADTQEFDVGGADVVVIQNKTAIANDTFEWQVSTLDSPTADTEWEKLTDNAGNNLWVAPNDQKTLRASLTGISKLRVKRTGAVDTNVTFLLGFERAK